MIRVPYNRVSQRSPEQHKPASSCEPFGLKGQGQSLFAWSTKCDLSKKHIRAPRNLETSSGSFSKLPIIETSVISS